MIPNSSFGREIASQRQRERMAQAQRERLGQQIAVAEAAAAEAPPQAPRWRLRRVLRAAFGLSGR